MKCKKFQHYKTYASLWGQESTPHPKMLAIDIDDITSL